jgi:hypothetical protein
MKSLKEITDMLENPQEIRDTLEIALDGITKKDLITLINHINNRNEPADYEYSDVIRYFTTPGAWKVNTKPEYQLQQADIITCLIHYINIKAKEEFKIPDQIEDGALYLYAAEDELVVPGEPEVLNDLDAQLIAHLQIAEGDGFNVANQLLAAGQDHIAHMPDVLPAPFQQQANVAEDFFPAPFQQQANVAEDEAALPRAKMLEDFAEAGGGIDLDAIARLTNKELLGVHKTFFGLEV